MRSGARVSLLGRRPDGSVVGLPVLRRLDYHDPFQGQETMLVGGLHSRLQFGGCIVRQLATKRRKSQERGANKDEPELFRTVCLVTSIRTILGLGTRLAAGSWLLKRMLWRLRLILRRRRRRRQARGTALVGHDAAKGIARTMA